MFHIPAYVTEYSSFILIVVAVMSFPVAWAADMVLKHLGFGVLGNYGFVFIGAYAGVIAIMLHVESASYVSRHAEFAFGGAAVGAFLCLFCVCGLKRIFKML